jgi:hypothetical protein
MNVLSFLTICLAVVLAFSSSNLVSAQIDPNICPFCEFGAMLIQGYLENNATTTEIELAFAAVCEVAPQSLQQACNNFVLNTLPILLQDLTEGKTAEQACADVGACTSAIVANAPRRMMKRRS